MPGQAAAAAAVDLGGLLSAVILQVAVHATYGQNVVMAQSNRGWNLTEQVYTRQCKLLCCAENYRSLRI
jgi:hypothetical protein